jgi:hypothetical protein
MSPANGTVGTRPLHVKLRACRHSGQRSVSEKWTRAFSVWRVIRPKEPFDYWATLRPCEHIVGLSEAARSLHPTSMQRLALKSFSDTSEP